MYFWRTLVCSLKVFCVVMFVLCYSHSTTAIFTESKHFHKNKENAERNDVLAYPEISFYWIFLPIRFKPHLYYNYTKKKRNYFVLLFSHFSHPSWNKTVSMRENQNFNVVHMGELLDCCFLHVYSFKYLICAKHHARR